MIEHTNLVAPERYGGRRFLYVANYLAPGHELLGLDADALLERYEPGLRRINPGFDRAWVRERWLHREPAAQPIVTVGYGERIPPLQTGVPGLVLAMPARIRPRSSTSSRLARGLLEYETLSGEEIPTSSTASPPCAIPATR